MLDRKQFRYNRADFGPLDVDLEHLDIELVFEGEMVRAVNCLKMKALKDIPELRLDAKDLEILSVTFEADNQPVDYDYDRNSSTLNVRLPGGVSAGRSFQITTVSTCVPSGSVLEGIYKDSTPEGCPQQYISQCQQWGFQRIMPIIDDCRAKCTMTTTIEADSRYTHLISNGNVSQKHNPSGKPVLKPGDPTRKVITYENPIPMAPYLFLVAVGTWDVLEDEVVYPSGRRVKLEYLVPPGRLEGARIPMEILKASVLWQSRTQEYEYAHDVYRTICMEKSNFGGMENVGNTTIVTDAALVDDYTTDRRLAYAYGVIIHEFEHNQCGSDVTMVTPFDMWLNEAFTVDVERQFSQTEFDPTVARLEEVATVRAPITGPLAIEEAGHEGRIVREAFNDPDELVDGLTYVKAAEVIRMLRLILGPDVFRKAKNAYFARYNGSNADTDQFFSCFEEESGRDLSQFRKEWLHSIGYPNVTVRHQYNAETRSLEVAISQERAGSGGMFHLPLSIAAVDSSGSDIASTSSVIEVKDEEQKVVFDDVPQPAFMSLNRDVSFYGTFDDASSTEDQLIAQVRIDPNLFNRADAMSRLTDRERVKLILKSGEALSSRWLELYREILLDAELPNGLKAHMLSITELSLQREYMPLYRERYRARKELIAAVAGSFMTELVDAWEKVDTYSRTPHLKDGYEDRQLKAVLLRTIMEADTPAVHNIAESHFFKAWHISDKASALRCICASTHPRREDLLAEAFDMWKDHLSAYLTYLSLAGVGETPEAFDLVSREEARSCFRPDHPGHTRALFVPMTTNNCLLWTDRGIEWVADTVLKLAPVNENISIRLVSCFQLVDMLADDLKPKVKSSLNRILKGIDASESPALAGRVRSFLRL